MECLKNFGKKATETFIPFVGLSRRQLANKIGESSQKKVEVPFLASSNFQFYFSVNCSDSRFPAAFSDGDSRSCVVRMNVEFELGVLVVKFDLNPVKTAGIRRLPYRNFSGAIFGIVSECENITRRSGRGNFQSTDHSSFGVSVFDFGNSCDLPLCTLKHLDTSKTKMVP